MKRGALPLLGAIGAALLCGSWSGAGQCREDRALERDREPHAFREHGAQPYSSGEQDRIRGLQQRGAILPLQQILERARRLRQGRVLETELEQHGERYVYELELVDDRGQVWEMKFDAASGELLDDEQEN